MDLENEVLDFTTEVYEKKHLHRDDVQFIIDLVRNFILKKYNPFLHQQLNKYLDGAVDKEVLDQIDRTFKKYSDPFAKYRTEDRRLRIYTDKGLYKEPESYEIETTMKEKCKQEETLIDNVPLKGIHIPLGRSLKRRLEKPGLFKAILHYKNYLESETSDLI